MHRLDCLAAAAIGNYELVKRKWEEMTAEEIKAAPLITGADLIAAGYTAAAFRRDPFRRRRRPIGTPPKHAGRSADWVLAQWPLEGGQAVPTRRFGRTSAVSQNAVSGPLRVEEVRDGDLRPSGPGSSIIRGILLDRGRIGWKSGTDGASATNEDDRE